MKRWISVFVLIGFVGVLAPFLRQVERRLVGVEPGVRLGNRKMEYYFEDEVRTIVRQLAREIDQPEVNASIHKQTGAVIPEQNGIHVDIEATVEAVINAPANAQLEPVLIETVPLVRAEHLEPLRL